MLSKFIYSFD